MANSCEEKTIYLTFDDGPDPGGGTETVLNVLRNNSSLKATFFLNMKKAEDNPSGQKRLIRNMVSEGHAIGNHGYEHAETADAKYYASVGVSKIKDDFAKNELAMEKLLSDGKACPTMEIARLQGDGRSRPEFVSMITNELKIAHAGWRVEFFPNGFFTSRLPDGGVKVRGKVDNPITGVTADYRDVHSIKDQDIVLMHDAHWRNKELLLDALIKHLSSKYVIKPATKYCSSSSVQRPQ